MAANTSPPPPRQGVDPEPAPVVTATPEKSKPVVLATRPLEEFVLPAPLDDKGEAQGEDIRVTPDGVALSKADAKRVLDAAATHNYPLIEKDDH
jgi:hypothetical protein